MNGGAQSLQVQLFQRICLSAYLLQFAYLLKRTTPPKRVCSPTSLGGGPTTEHGSPTKVGSTIGSIALLK